MQRVLNDVELQLASVKGAQVLKDSTEGISDAVIKEIGESVRKILMASGINDAHSMLAALLVIAAFCAATLHDADGDTPLVGYIGGTSLFLSTEMQYFAAEFEREKHN